MKNKSNVKEKKWIQTRAFYSVAISLILVIAGIGTAIFNVAKLKGYVNKSGDDNTSYSSTKTTEKLSDSQANAKITGIADNRTTTFNDTTANDLNRPYSGYYLLPLNGNVKKDYSNSDMVYSKTMGDWRTHDGIDVTGNIGDNVIAIQDGEITDIYTDTLWGDIITIQHGNGLSAKYCGVKASVKKDSKIEQGQVLGTLVEIPIEKSDGTHVHLETYVDQKYVDPIKAMNMLNEETSSQDE